jgi:predicted ATPase
VNNWYVITGTTSTGKTTLIDELAKRGYKTVPEAARTLIDQAATKGISAKELRTNEREFNREVLRLKQELDARQDPNELVFFDRGVHDILAYARYYQYDHIEHVIEAAERSRYRKVFLLDQLPYEHDYARTEDAEFSQDIQRLLEQVYTEYDMMPIHVPVLEGGPAARADFVLQHVGGEQDGV